MGIVQLYLFHCTCTMVSFECDLTHLRIIWEESLNNILFGSCSSVGMPMGDYLDEIN